MKYLDGNDILPGDQVDLGGGMTGVVVGCLDEEKSAPGFSKEQWDYPAEGVWVNSRQAGLIHYPKLGVDLVLLQREKL